MNAENMTSSPDLVLSQKSRSRLEGLYDFFKRRPLSATLLIFAINFALSLLSVQAAQLLLPGTSADFVSLIVITLLTVAAVSALGWWRVSGYNSPGQWRSLGLLLLPYITLGALPLVLGINQVPTSSGLYFLLAYALVALHEETIFRGVIVHILGPRGPRQAILISSLLFGLSHLTNLFVRSNPFLTLAQVVGAFSSGVGLAAVRLRTNTIWFVLGLHFLEDFLLHYTRLPAIPLNVAQSVILLFYGLYLMRNRQALETAQDSGVVDSQVTKD